MLLSAGSALRRGEKRSVVMRMTGRLVFAFTFAGLMAGLTAVGLPQQGAIGSEAYVWKNVKIGGGGFIPGIVFNAKQPGLVFCRTDIGSSYRWDNKARKWMPLTDWCGVSNFFDNQQGLFRSDDVSATWVRINDDRHQYGNRFRCITGDPRIYGRVYVGTDGRGIVYGDRAP
jgi:hypothetical protein